MIRAIVFDLFDTLVDLRWERLPVAMHNGKKLPPSVTVMYERVQQHRALELDAFIEAMLEGDKGFAESHYKHDREVPTQLRMSELLRRLDVQHAELAGELTRLHMGVFRQSVELIGHHGDVLDALRRSHRLGLCSNFSHSETALAVLRDAGLHRRLEPDALVVSDAFGLRKPRAEIFAEVVKRLGVSPAETLHVGDSLRADVVGAARAGMRTAWITRRVSDPGAALAEHDGPAPDHVIADLAELPALVSAL
jgi:putative hydrolase of the HAD superfamily